MADYEVKFAELQKYIPFMENMIARLENTKPGDSNPRGAQLEKIKALRNLLIDKNKKMKMENLLKCEQVLTNLYSKVGESDAISTNTTPLPEPETKETAVRAGSSCSIDLQSVREKLKIVTSLKVAEKSSVAESPIISPTVRSEVRKIPAVHEVIAAPLFERRPRKSTKSRSLSPKIISSRSPEKPAQRKYTRVLQSPEPKSGRWRSPDKKSSSRKNFNDTENQLFHRRSPRKSPGRSPRWRRSRSFSPHKRKKSSKKEKKSKSFLSDDVNITLNVPEESLSSLNTSNLMDRIVNCSKDDVDIDQLREIRAKIVKELQQTGANQDISDYILKSYRKEEKKKKKKAKKEIEVEDGELTDSESETRDKVYGNLTIEVKNDHVEADEVVCTTQGTLLNHLKTMKPALENTNRRNSPKIKISLIISNADSDGTITPERKLKKTGFSTPTTSFLTDVASNGSPFSNRNSPSVKDISLELKDSLSIKSNSSYQNTEDKVDKTAVINQSPFFYGEMQIGDKLTSPQTTISKKICELEKIKEKVDLKSPQVEAKGENSTKNTNSVVDSPKRAIDSTPKIKEKENKISTEIESKSGKEKNKDNIHATTSKDSKNEGNKLDSLKANKELSAQTSQIISKYINNLKEVALSTSPVLKVDNVSGISKDISSSRSNLTIKQIASSIEAVSKPKLSKHANTPLDKLSALLYKDLSPSESPKSSPKQSSTLSDKYSPDPKKSAIKYEKKHEAKLDNKTFSKSADSKEDNTKDSEENIPFLSGSPKKPEVSEIDILKALKNDILDLNIPKSSSETPSLHQPKISKVTDKSQLEADKKKRISLEKYKEKSGPSIMRHPKPSDSKDQVKLLSKALTAKEYERFQAILKSTMDADDISDDDTNINISFTPDSPDMPESLSQKETDMGPKSPEQENFCVSPRDSPILIPSDPVKQTEFSIVNSSRRDVDMRVLNIPTSNAAPLLKSPPYALPNLPKGPTVNTNNDSQRTKTIPPLISGLDSQTLEERFNNEGRSSMNRDFPISANYKGRHPIPLMGYPKEPLLGRAPNIRSYVTTGSMTPSRAPQMTASRAPSMTPRAPNMTPSRAPNMTPSMTPSYSFGDDNFPTRRHVYASFDLGTPSWDDRDAIHSPVIRDDGSSTPIHVFRESRVNFWDNSDARNSPLMRDDLSDVGSCTPIYDPHNRKGDNLNKSRNNEFFRSVDSSYSQDVIYSNISRAGRTDPRLDRKDDRYQRDNQDVHNQGYLSDPRQRNVCDYDRSHTRESSVGPIFSQEKSFLQDRPFDADSVNRPFIRESSVGRNIAREPSVGRSLPVDERSSATESSSNQAVELREDPRRVREQSVGRSFVREPSVGRTVRESSVGRNVIHDQSRSRSNREVSVGHTLHRERSVSRDVPYESAESRRNFTRASSVGRSLAHDTIVNNNQIPVWDIQPSQCSYQKQNVGRSFTREPSVGRSFTREPSIGRSFTRESSVGRNCTREPSIGRHVARATSVGRNIIQEPTVGSHTSRDYDRYTDRTMYSEKNTDRSKDPYRFDRRGRNPGPRESRARSVGRRDNESTQSIERISNDRKKSRKFNYRDPRTRREEREKAKSGYSESDNQASSNKSSPKSQSSSKNSSPKKGKFDMNRDPRLRSTDPRCPDDRTKNTRDDKKQSGISYTSDNIAKGQILGSGYGVRNYKIPKIKRPIEEIPAEKDESADIINELLGETNTQEKYETKDNDETRTEIKESEKSAKNAEKNILSTIEKKTENTMTLSIVKTENEIIDLDSPDESVDNTAFNDRYAIADPQQNSTDGSDFDELISNIQRRIVEPRSDSEESAIESNVSKDKHHIVNMKESNLLKENLKSHEFKIQSGIVDVVSEVEINNEVTVTDDSKIECNVFTSNPIINADISEVTKQGKYTVEGEEKMSLKDNRENVDQFKDLIDIEKESTLNEKSSATTKKNCVEGNTHEIKSDSTGLLLSEKEIILDDNLSASSKFNNVEFVNSKLSCNENIIQSEHMDTSISRTKAGDDSKDPNIADTPVSNTVINYKNLEKMVTSLPEKRPSADETAEKDIVTEISMKPKFVSEKAIDSIEKSSNITCYKSVSNVLSTITANTEKSASTLLKTMETVEILPKTTVSDQLDAKTTEKSVSSIVKKMEMTEMLAKTTQPHESDAKTTDNLQSPVKKNGQVSRDVFQIKENQAASDQPILVYTESIENISISDLKTIENSNKPDNIYDFVDEIIPEQALEVISENEKSASRETADDPAQGDTENTNAVEKNKENLGENEVNKYSSTIPDSTILDNVAETAEGNILPDSTDETENNEVLTDTIEVSAVSSSQDLEKEIEENIPKTGTSTKGNDLNPLQSLGSILSLLQDRTKMKEILSLLSDNSSETEKLKRKLAKLSELASDDEDMAEAEKEAAPHEKATKESEKDRKKSENTVKILDGPEKEPKKAVNQETESSYDTSFDQIQNLSRIFPKNLRKIKHNRTKRGKKGLTKMNGSTIKNLKSDKRVTRSEAQKPKAKKTRNRELESLQENLREMFDSEEVLTASVSGIRNCRLAKLIDEKPLEPSSEQNDEIKNKESIKSKDSTPVVVLPKIPLTGNVPPSDPDQKIRKKPGPKPKLNREGKGFEDKRQLRTKSGPKFTKANVESKSTEANQEESSDDESLSSLISTSSERLAEPKPKAKRKSSSWKLGYIKSRRKKNKEEQLKNLAQEIPTQIYVKIPDYGCYIDKRYCFYKSAQKYQCRLCGFEGLNIVHHYKQKHPHVEVPLSRINPKSAHKAIEQSLTTDFEKINKKSKPRQKIICRFCFQVFQGPRSILEKFFWHVVSTHTGEYKHSCSVCPSDDKCPTSLDIPSPPEEAQVLLLGFICGECHYTQISLNNLKTHVALRHNNDETEVYSINLCDLPPKIEQTSTESPIMDKDEKSNETAEDRTRRSLRSKTSVDSNVTLTSNTSSIDSNKSADQSKIIESPSVSPPKRTLRKNRPKFTFEADDDSNDESVAKDVTETKKSVKSEIADTYVRDDEFQINVIPEESSHKEPMANAVIENTGLNREVEIKQEPLDETNTTTELETPAVYDKDSHFMIAAPKDAAKSYVCKIKGCKTDYRTSLLVALKKHVQLKHKDDIWDGYCLICNIKLSGMENTYSQCLSHLLEYHMDEFPMHEEEITKETPETAPAKSSTPVTDLSRRTYVNVRPLSDLISKHTEQPSVSVEKPDDLPRIDSVVSLQNDPSTALQNMSQLATTVASKPTRTVLLNSSQMSTPKTSLSPSPTTNTEVDAIPRNPKTGTSLVNPINALNLILAEKHSAVREAMLRPSKLVQVFKCAGRYCSYAGNDVEKFIIHIQSHLKYENRDNSNVLCCTYCDYVSQNNAVDLVSHIFREHGHCRFSCQYCFYIATSAAMVWMHRTLEHPVQPAIAPLPMDPKCTDEEAFTRDMLTRGDAVLPYKCTFLVVPPGSSAEEKCKYRGYTSAKFIDHIMLRHKNETILFCKYCKEKFTQASYLIGHLRQHGLCLYQCTYCLYGIDTESGMLQHITQYHPNRRPQAYLRHIIENKETTAGPTNPKLKYKVLPLVLVDRINIQSEDPPKINQIDSPESEVERARELEILIKQHEPPSLNVFSDSELNKPQSSRLEQITDIPKSQPTPIEGPIEPNIPGDTSHSIPPVLKPQQEENNLLKKPKTEPQNLEDHKIMSYDDIICLDSDDDDKSKAQKASKNIRIGEGVDVIALSDDEASAPPSSTSTEKIADKQSEKELRFYQEDLLKCQKCQRTSKNHHFHRAHFLECYTDLNARVRCPFCPLVMSGYKGIRNHLIQSHGPIKSYTCGVCKLEKKATAKPIINHMKSAHGIKGHIQEVENDDPYDLRYILFGNTDKPKTKPGPKPGWKRKLSQTMVDRAPKVPKRYGPEDIEHLPINPILDEAVVCARCEYGTKVRSNMLRHLQMHANEIAVPSAAPVNPVPHLESNEMHFDKMTNLAASSNVMQRPERTTRSEPVMGPSISPETAAKYPKYVPDKERNVCGAIGCSYISVDEAMLKCHWETLHSGVTAYRCVHCPATQQLDTSRPLTASRIVGHLKMHDVRLYACGSCGYYHFQLHMVERHVTEKHGLNSRGALVLREPADLSAPAVPAETRTAPTMDLKPWQCGLCKFKSMLRPEVSEHCVKIHNQKFQFKCSFCPFSGSVQTTVNRHQTERHLGRSERDVIHVYYKERSLPADKESGPLWTKQVQWFASLNEIVKSEVSETTPPLTSIIIPSPAKSMASDTSSTSLVNLDIVKSEVEDHEETLEELTVKYGSFGQPKGELYACPLCNVTTEDARQAMMTHLHEELNYRKWACNICTYKAFSKIRMMEHSFHEHKQTQEPQELSPNRGIEIWVQKLLDHQEGIINTNKLSKETILTGQEKQKELERIFGSYGKPYGQSYACPRCDFKAKEESKMYEHLEMEMGKFRWSCSSCNEKFQNYHECEHHCTELHLNEASQVKSITKDRSSWIAGVLLNQKLSMKLHLHTSETITNEQRLSNATTDFETAADDSSLLVVRYEEDVQPMMSPRKQQPSRKRKPTCLREDDSDEESNRLVIVESPIRPSLDSSTSSTVQPAMPKCPHCKFTTKYHQSLQDHVIRHYKRKPFVCVYCPYFSDVGCERVTLKKHLEKEHPAEHPKYERNQIPKGPILKAELIYYTKAINKNLAKSDVPKPEKVVKMSPVQDQLSHMCLLCDTPLTNNEAKVHHSVMHTGANCPPQIVVKGGIVLKCWTCQSVQLDVEMMRRHHETSHPGIEINYTKIKLGSEPKDVIACLYCNKTFKFLADYKCHHNTTHANLSQKYAKKAEGSKSSRSEDEDEFVIVDDNIPKSTTIKRKREEEEPISSKVNRVAKKSTTRLPYTIKAYARKSTTRLPYSIDLVSSDDENTDYSFYGTKPSSLDEFANVTTVMPLCGKMVTLTVEKFVKKFGDIINISPVVMVEDLNNPGTTKM